MNFSTNNHSPLDFWLFMFWLNIIIDDVTAAILIKNREHCHIYSFQPNFTKCLNRAVLRITTLGIAIMLSYDRTFGDGSGRGEGMLLIGVRGE